MYLNAENKLVLFFVSGFLIILTSGYLGWFGFENILNTNIMKIRRLDDKTGLSIFKKLPVPLEFNVYFFNVINPNDVLKGDCPILEEVGPYVYEEYITKTVLNSSDPKIIRYMKNSSFKFSEEKSNGLKESDIVTIVNVPLLAIGLFLEKNMPLALDMLEETIPYLFSQKNQLFLNNTVRELLFQGIPIKCTEESSMFCSALKQKPSESIKFDEETGHFSFAFFRQRNGSIGPYEADKGIDDVRKVGQIYSFKDQADIGVWVPNSTCNVLKGTDATIFGPFLETNEPLYVYEPDICLTGSVEYEGEYEYLGVEGSIFVGSITNFVETNTTCRCPREDFDDPLSIPQCLPPGLIDLTPCQGAPVIASQPHFYQGDVSLRFSSVLRAEPEKHRTFTVLDRLTGFPLKARKRFQLNIQLRPIEDISLLENVTDLIFPVLWVDEGIELQPKDIKELVSMYKILFLIRWLRWLIMGIGLFLILVGVIYFIYYKNNKKAEGNGAVEKSQDRILFNKVKRQEETNSNENNPSLQPNLELSPQSFLREQINNNINRNDSSYVMRLNSKLYPDNINNKNNYIYPS